METNQVNTTNTIAQEFAAKVQQDAKKGKIVQYAPIFILIALVLIFSITAEGFFTGDNLTAILTQLAIPLVLSVGATFVIIMGSIDLSVDGMMALCGCVASILIANTKNTMNLGIWGVFIAIGVGAGFGFLAGLLYVKLKIPSFMVTFGLTNVGAGLAVISYGLEPATVTDEAFRSLALTNLGPAPIITYIALGVFVVALILQNYTPFGRYVFAIGDNEQVPRMAGIKVNKVKIQAFIWSGVCIGIAGVLMLALLGRGDVTMGKGQLFPALTAVVVGGTAMSGGRGGIVNTLIGALIMTVLRSGLIMFGVSQYMLVGVQGVIILIAVAASVARGKKIINK